MTGTVKGKEQLLYIHPQTLRYQNAFYSYQEKFIYCRNQNDSSHNSKDLFLKIHLCKKKLHTDRHGRIWLNTKSETLKNELCNFFFK